MNTLLRGIAAFFGFGLIAAYAGNLTVNIAPPAAVSAGAQWRVDGGNWRNSGFTIKNLSNATHQVEFKPVSGWLAPAVIAVAITNNPTTLAATYVQPAALTVSLSPANGQWRVDGGPWRASGTTATGLTPGSHTIDYANLSGYANPVSETIALTAGQTATLARSYTQLAQVTVTLTPAQAQWRIDSGAWQSSGATVANLTPGVHGIDYLSITGYVAPAAESVTLTSGQSLALQRAYVQMAEIWLSLVPASGQWRANGGAWQPSGARQFVSPGEHLIEFAPIDSYDPPASETVSLASGGLFGGTKYYTSQKPTLVIHLSPTAGQWRLDSGAWQPSGTVLTELSVGMHTLEYTDIGGDYAPLVPETITLALRDRVTLQRSYSLKPASLAVMLTPNYQQWRAVGAIDTGWQNSGATVAGLPPGPYQVEYSALANYDAPPVETITLSPAQAANISRTYTAHPASFSLVLNPTNAEWRLYPFLGSPSGPWRASGAVETGLAPGRYKLEFSSVAGHTPPDISMVSLAPGEHVSLTGSYTPIPPRLQVNLYPGDARFRVDGGAWNYAGALVEVPSPGDHLLEFEPIAGYETPAPQTVTLSWGELRQLEVRYIAIERATLTVHLDPSSGQFRLPGGPWLASGSSVVYLIPGSYQVEFAPVDTYVTPSPQTVTLSPGENRQVTVTYTPLPRVRANLTPAHAQWRIDESAWRDSGVWVTGLSVGEHTITFSDVVGYLTPTPETLTLAAGDLIVLDKAYQTGAASLQVSITPSHARWRLDNGAWLASGASASCGSGPHVLEFEPLSGYATPNPENLTLAVNENRVLARSYTATAPAYSVIKTLHDSGAGVAIVRGSDGRLYCAANSVGVSGRGQIYRLNADGTGYTLLKAFGGQPSETNSPTSLIESSDGYLYGTNQYTGTTSSGGSIFRLAKDGSGFAHLWVFTGAESAPTAITEGSDGALYGTTSKGGNSNAGVIFTLQNDGTNYRTIYSSYGARGVTEGLDGWLYATISTGSFGGTFGSIFKVTKQNFGFQLLRNLNDAMEGASPRAALLRSSDGVFYGTTSAGGTANKGVVFRINADGTGYAVLRSFLGDATDGGRLDAPVIEGPGGALYGVTYNGGSANRGTVFRLGKDGSGYAVLRHFLGSAADGGILTQPLTVSAEGVLYGANTFGGGDNRGAIFRLNADGTSFNTLHHLAAPDGAVPRGVIQATDGALYGVANVGGGAGKGVVYKMTPDGSGYTVLHRFAATNDGWQPHAPLLEGSDGRLYGVTLDGHPTTGALFALNKDGSGYTRIHTFGGTGDGWGPYGSVIEASDGMLYGTTVAGGAGGYGTIYRLNKDGSGFAILRSFAQSSSEGNTPAGCLLEGPDGMLYGTTSTGATNLGAVFKLSKDGSAFAVLHGFGGGPTDGAGPWAGLVLASNSRLYGTTNAGGQNGKGTIFSLNLDGSSYVVVKSFLGGTIEGAEPTFSGLVEKTGALYGTTFAGGVFDGGTIYSVSLAGSEFRTLINFGVNSADGRGPLDSLTRSPTGVFYGTTKLGGNGGTVFRLETN